MTTALVVLVAVVIGGGYIFYRVSQEQYYVAADSSGKVVIYRGISEHIAGFNWSSPYEQTGIELAQVPSNYQQTVKTAYSTGGLTQVRQTVANIRTAVNDCRNAYTALQTWATAVNKYTTSAEVTAAKKKHPDGQHRQPRPAAAQAARATGRRGRDVPAPDGLRHPGQYPRAGRLRVSLTGAAGSRDAVRCRRAASPPRHRRSIRTAR